MAITPCILTRVPEPGMTKTRLAKSIGDDAAANVAQAMARCTIARWSLAAPATVAITPDGAAQRMRQHLTGIPDVTIVDQGDGSLGERIERSWLRAVGDHSGIVLGTDSPDVPMSLMHATMRRAMDNDVVLGPTTDGGYWTLAMRQWIPEMVRDIEWGTSVVFSTSVEQARHVGASISVLPRWYDVDEIADLRALRRRLRQLMVAPTESPASQELLTELHEALVGLDE